MMTWRETQMLCMWSTGQHLGKGSQEEAWKVTRRSSLTMSEEESTEAGVPRMGSHHRQEMGRSALIASEHGDGRPQSHQVEPYLVQEFTFSSPTSSEDRNDLLGDVRSDDLYVTYVAGGFSIS
ncbi:hypothetical protein AAFF_G00236630 [Aldrovandia affinis]|uniref:Uncharacterized protein n=1 Tax=Aldrovandia affinis TaxID=143900 RepID=A0AAD7W478_9TELE|nr:hypothetical protein AAFF_G00236630 [Aldrovandia affinis]